MSASDPTRTPFTAGVMMASVALVASAVTAGSMPSEFIVAMVALATGGLLLMTIAFDGLKKIVDNPGNAPVTELIVFRNRSEAVGAGFRNDKHPDHAHIWAWWPSLGLIHLARHPVQRVTVSGSMSSKPTCEGRIYDVLRSRQKSWGDKAMWVELA